ncbi:MAG TPA: DinB family protein [Gemmatimonadaceae bacterium]|nr:DinB family protein [Gemmatimonadaceae bacterium]HXD49398.1 DinB family protein [Gemmatimonadaceae bacterium]
MHARVYVAIVAAISLPSILPAQASPVAQAFREFEADEAKNLVAAAVEMPADKYSFKPTPAQMSFGQIVTHLAAGNDYFCSAIGGATAPKRSKIDATATKDALVARLRETFQFCDESLSKLDDSNLNEMLPFFNMPKKSRAGLMTVATGDWADHYSQSAVYLRLNGLLPPTAKRPAQ